MRAADRPRRPARWSRAFPPCGCCCSSSFPFLIVLKISFSEARLAIPPYAPLIDWLHGLPAPQMHLANYAFLFTDPLYLRSYLYSLKVAAVSTLFCLLIGYPMAYAIARAGCGLAHLAADADHAAVLDVVPAARLCLDRAAAEQRRHQQRAAEPRRLIHQPVTLLQTDFSPSTSASSIPTCRS